MSTFAARFALTEVGDRRWRWFAAAAGFVGVVYAVLSVVGGRQEWANIFADGNGRWGWAPIPVALGLGLCGAMVVLESQQWNAWARAAAALALGWTLGAATQEIAAASGPWPGRIAPALVLTAIVAAAGVMPSRQRPLAAALAAVPLFLSFVVAVQTLLGMTPWTPLGPHTRLLNPVPAVCLLLASAGWMAAQPRRRPVALLREPSSTGWMMRRLAPMVLVFPLLVVWIRSQRNLSHPMGTWIGSLVFVGLSFVVFLTLLWKAASALDRLDTSRADLQAYAREISDLYHHAPCGYHSLDADGTFVKINDTELMWLGYRREEVIGKLAFSDLLTPPSRALFERHFPQVQASGAVAELEVEMVRKDGSILPAVVSATAIRDHSGKFLRTRSTLFDATQRKQAEAALRMSEARNRAILASAADAIVTLDEAGAIVEFNPSAEWMFGIRRSVAIEMMAADLMDENSPLAACSMAELGGELDPAAPRHREFTARRADGSLFPAELTVTRVAGLTPGLFTALIRDLTQRKRAEADLRMSEERLRLLLDSTGEGIYALDLEGHCTLCNPAAVRLLGYESADDLLGKLIHNLIHHTRADGSPYPASECKSFLSARQGIGIEVDDEVFWRKDGSSFPVEYRSYPVERDGAAVGLVVTFTDITTRRGLENQIRQSQKMEAVGRLAAGIAHDFNNLLTVINGYSDMLLENDLGEDAHDKLRSVRTAGDRAATLTHQLLAFSRQQVLQPRMLDLNAAVRALEPLLRRSIGEDIELRIELAQDLQPIKADPSQLDQVLMNLVVNARDAMPEGGTLRIETANVSLDEAFVRPHPGLSKGDYALLTVSDTGTGMRPETQTHIFEPFFTTKPQGKGTGLGLPTVFGIARQSGGTILVDSEWGRGTRMQVYLPVFSTGAHAAPSAPSAARDSAPREAKETVLVVEDEDEIRHALLAGLRGAGYNVIDASRPDQALALSQEYSGGIDLLITEVGMPSMSGQALAQRVRQQRPATRVLFVAAQDEPAAVPTPFLTAPFTPEALAGAVRAALVGEYSEADSSQLVADS